MLWRIKKYMRAFCRYRWAGQQQAGFTIVEALVATAIMGIGFAGSLTLMAITNNSSDKAVAKQKLQMLSNQILEVIDSDLDNIASYDLDLKACIVPDLGETDKFDLRQYDWCMKINAELGAATIGEAREIDVVTLNGRRVVTITLEARDSGVNVITKRTYDL